VLPQVYWSKSMKRHSALWILVFVVFSILPCYAHHMAVVVNTNNNVGPVTSGILSRIFKSEIKKWPDGKNVVLVLHKSSNMEMLTLERLNKMTEEDLRALIAAHKDSIIMADSDAALLKTIEAIPGAVGLVDVRAVDGNVKVLKVDGKLPLEEGYLPH
jgi:ABC-type phosphate transport system substrate-binding protein